jgi:hypothetical protein
MLKFLRQAEERNINNIRMGYSKHDPWKFERNYPLSIKGEKK